MFLEKAQVAHLIGRSFRADDLQQGMLLLLAPGRQTGNKGKHEREVPETGLFQLIPRTRPRSEKPLQGARCRPANSLTTLEFTAHELVDFESDIAG